MTKISKYSEKLYSFVSLLFRWNVTMSNKYTGLWRRYVGRILSEQLLHTYAVHKKRERYPRNRLTIHWTLKFCMTNSFQLSMHVHTFTYLGLRVTTRWPRDRKRTYMHFTQSQPCFCIVISPETGTYYSLFIRFKLCKWIPLITAWDKRSNVVDIGRFLCLLFFRFRLDLFQWRFDRRLANGHRLQSYWPDDLGAPNLPYSPVSRVRCNPVLHLPFLCRSSDRFSLVHIPRPNKNFGCGPCPVDTIQSFHCDQQTTFTFSARICSNRD